MKLDGRLKSCSIVEYQDTFLQCNAGTESRGKFNQQILGRKLAQPSTQFNSSNTGYQMVRVGRFDNQGQPPFATSALQLPSLVRLIPAVITKLPPQH